MLNSVAYGASASPETSPRKGGAPHHLTRLLQVAACIILVSSITAASLARYGGSGCALVGSRSPGSMGEEGKLLKLLPQASHGLVGATQPDDASAPPINSLLDDSERFLIVAGVTEQLGKAIYHMEDLFELCLLSNRTCVLPGISGGQFALDGALSFGDIFDLRSIPAPVRTVQWDHFATHFRRRFGDVPSELSSTSSSPSSSSSSPLPDPPPHLPRVTMCAIGKETVSDRMVTAFQRTASFYQPNAAFAMDPACETTMIGFPADRQQQAANLEAVMSVLARRDDHPIVAAFHYEWSEPFPRPTQLPGAGYAGLDFNARFYEQAVAFGQQVGDYIHLQWRMEKADGGKSTNYTACALAAIRHIRALSQKAGVDHVYFSSDLGRDGVPWSNSFGGTVPKDALNALNLIYDEFPSLLTWLNVTSPMLPHYDMAAVGVMDRLIAMGSTYFVRGPSTCSRVGAYVQSIGKWRKKRLEAREADGRSSDDAAFGSRIMNEADEFAL